MHFTRSIRDGRDRRRSCVVSKIRCAGTRPRCRLRGTITRIALVCFAWMSCIAAGMIVLNDYSTQPSDGGNAPARAPKGPGGITLSGDSPTLLLFAHSHCPCTRASIGELERIVARCSGRMETHVYFIPPSPDCTLAMQSDLWSSAAAIPGVAVYCDPIGAVAHSFGAKTSGQVLLYAADHTLVYAGGITASRGHHGDNVGGDAIVSYLLEGRTLTSTAPVYGCALFDTQQTQVSENAS